MTTASILVIFAGYAVMSYGYVLLKGYDITWKDWLNPLAPYAWPGSGSPPVIPAGKLLP